MAKNKKEETPDENEELAPSSPAPAEIQKINAIRDIIFGHDMAEYDQQFKQVRNLIADNAQSIIDQKEDILQRMDSLQDHFNDALRALENRLTEEIEKLQYEKTDRQMLGSLLEEIGKKIKS